MTCSKIPRRLAMLKPLALLIAAVAVFTLACGDESPTSTSVPSLFPILLKDSNGDVVILPEPPERIVSIGSAAVEILFELGEGHRVAGTHDFVSYPPETAGIAKVGTAFALDIEKIVSLEPDLIYTFFESPVEDLERVGAPILYLENPQTLEEVAERIRMWGELVGKQETGMQLAQDFEEAIYEIRDRLTGISVGPRIYHDEAPGFWTTGSDSLANETYTLLKAENAFSDIGGYSQVSTEQIVERDPQIIISIYEDGPESFRSTPAFQDMSAVKNNRLYAIDGDLLAIAGPRLIEGIELLAELFYPELAP